VVKADAENVNAVAGPSYRRRGARESFAKAIPWTKIVLI
jgi:hypothetical protein